MSEKLSSKKPEKSPHIDLKEARQQLEQIGEKLRHEAEKAPSKEDREKHVEEATKSAEKLALSSREQQPSKGESASQKEPVSRGIKKQTYRATMNRVESRLPRYQRTFSKVINNSAVDAVSNVAGRTVARPSALLGGGLAAFVGLAIFTYYAKKIGFQLSGSEFFVLVAVGWAAGLMLEGIFKLARQFLKR